MAGKTKRKTKKSKKKKPKRNPLTYRKARSTLKAVAAMVEDFSVSNEDLSEEEMNKLHEFQTELGIEDMDLLP